MKAATALAKMTSEAPKQKPAMERRRKRRRRQRKRVERTSQGSRNSRWPCDKKKCQKTTGNGHKRYYLKNSTLRTPWIRAAAQAMLTVSIRRRTDRTNPATAKKRRLCNEIVQ